MGRIYLSYLSSRQVYICGNCSVHLATHDDIISKAFQGRHGKAYLFKGVVNITAGVVEKRMLRTGAHQVADIYCKNCQDLLGWKYEVAYEDDQKYKEGKYILEKAKFKRSPNWVSTAT